MIKKITNTNNKRLTFSSLDFSIGDNEIKKVTNEQFNVLIRNYWIKEVVGETKEIVSKKTLKKGRKKRINN